MIRLGLLAATLIFLINMAIYIGLAWLGVSFVTSFLKQHSNSCGQTYVIEEHGIQANWFCKTE